MGLDRSRLPPRNNIINQSSIFRTARQREMRSKYWHTRERSNYRAVHDVNRTLASESTARLRALITSNRRHDMSVTPCVPGLSGQLCAFLKEGTWSRFPFVDYPSYHSGGHVGNKMSSGATWRHTRVLSPPVLPSPTVSLVSVHPFVLISVSRPF